MHRARDEFGRVACRIDEIIHRSHSRKHASLRGDDVPVRAVGDHAFVRENLATLLTERSSSTLAHITV